MGLEVVDTPFGKFQISPRDIIGSTTKAGTLWDGGFLAPVAYEYAGLGEVGTTVIDVGANIGTFSIWCATHGAWRVLAVEAHPGVAQMLRSNIDLNRCYDRVIPIEGAAWGNFGYLVQGRLNRLEEDGNLGSHYVRHPERSEEGNVAAIPLDSLLWFCGQRVGLVKIDVEGAELEVLKGMNRMIEMWYPTLALEWDPANRGTDEVPHWLLMHGYTMYEWPSLPHNYVCRSHRRPQ